MTTLPARLLTLATSLPGPDAETVRQAAEVIERLPVTADGVPVTPGMTVWAWFADSHDDGPEPVTIEHLRPSGTYKGCYSTREAAEAAAREAKEAL